MKKLRVSLVTMIALLLLGQEVTPSVSPKLQPEGDFTPSIEAGVNTPQSNILATATAPAYFASFARNVIGAQASNIPVALKARPISVAISGPTMGTVNIAYTFTATVSPSNAKLPIGYIWEATWQSTIITITRSLIHVVSFTWSTTGTRVITVTAMNASSSATDYHAITIGIVPVQHVTISGPTMGITDTDYAFSAAVSPPNASLPITHTWSPPPVAGQGSTVVTYTWGTWGAKTIAVTAMNAGGTATDSHVITIGPGIAVVSVAITGPTTGTINTEYAFTATVSPPDATTPIIYTWSPTPTTGQGSAVVTYIWPITGSQTITITAKNGGDPITASHIVTIGIVSMQHVTISGYTTGIVDTDYAFCATINPPDASPPITYTWTPTPTMGQSSPNVIYNWPTGGVKFITVTATNISGTVTVSHVITIGVPPVEVCCVTITGLITGTIDIEYAYTATVGPPDATPPTVYTWSPMPVTGQGFLNVTYRWMTPGIKVISVTAWNYYGIATNTYTITVEAVPVVSVTINGPTTGIINKSYTFTATVSPVTATPPITYVWQATKQNDVVTTTNAPSYTAIFTWSTIGTQAIIVTATNAGNTVTDTRAVTVSIPPSTEAYLPVVLYCWPPTPRTPKLNPISNDDGDGNYTVSWIGSGSACLAESYVLEEATDSAFSGTVQIHPSIVTSHAITDNTPTRYYYHVKAHNNWGDSGWSNVQWVDVWWEHELNNSFTEANGPLVSGVDYYGFPNDIWDCFWIKLDGPGQIMADLTRHTGQGVQLFLYSPSEETVCRDFYAPYHIDCPVTESGRYYICIYTERGYNSNTNYTLRATFP